MSSNRLISVIIPAYNSAPYISEAIDSVLGQSYSDYEIIVIDDASTDNTGEVLNKYSDNPKVSVIRLDVCSGVAAARNAGLGMARGDIVALLDADDIWLPEKLNKQYQALKEEPEAGWAYCNGAVVDQNIKKMYFFTERWNHTGGMIYEDILLKSLCVPVSSVIIKREVFDHCGLFDPDLKTVEDLDLFLRIARKYKCVYLKEPLFNYRVHNDNLSRKEDRMEAGRLKVLGKLIDLHPEYESELRCIHHRSVGIGMLGMRDCKRARMHFIKAAHYRQRDYKVWIGLLLATMPRPVLDLIIKTKKKCIKKPLF